MSWQRPGSLRAAPAVPAGQRQHHSGFYIVQGGSAEVVSLLRSSGGSGEEGEEGTPVTIATSYYLV